MLLLMFSPEKSYYKKKKINSIFLSNNYYLYRSRDVKRSTI